MFETPTIDLQELRSVLTDAGHTAVGLATMAAKKVNDVRLDLNDRYDDQTADLRSNLLTVVEKIEDVRVKMEARMEPVLEAFTDRLPTPARKVVENLTDTAKDAQAKAHKFVVEALTVETKAAETKAAATKSTPKATAAKPTAKVAKAKAAKTKPAAKSTKPAAKTAKPATTKPATAKTVAKKTTAKKTATK